MQEDRILGVRGVAACGADFDEYWRCLLARVEEDAGDVDAVHVSGGDGGRAAGGMQRCEAEADDQGVGARDADGFGEVVDAGSEQQIPALR